MNWRSGELHAAYSELLLPWIVRKHNYLISERRETSEIPAKSVMCGVDDRPEVWRAGYLGSGGRRILFCWRPRVFIVRNPDSVYILV